MVQMIVDVIQSTVILIILVILTKMHRERGKEVKKEEKEEQFTRFVRGEISENQYLGKKEEGKFEKGDRVVGVGRRDGVDLTGMTGIVLVSNPFELGVRFDEEHENFHDLSGATDRLHGFWVHTSNLKHA